MWKAHLKISFTLWVWLISKYGVVKLSGFWVEESSWEEFSWLIGSGVFKFEGFSNTKLCNFFFLPRLFLAWNSSNWVSWVSKAIICSRVAFLWRWNDFDIGTNTSCSISNSVSNSISVSDSGKVVFLYRIEWDGRVPCFLTKFLYSSRCNGDK